MAARELKFLLKLALFCLPIALILSFPLWVMSRSGELLSDDAMVARQTSAPNPVVVGLTFSNPVYYMQLHAAIAKKPNVLVLGSSRIQQIRADFFGTSTAYIAAGSAQKISHFRHFLDKIPASATPKVLILGLDQKFFNPAYDSLAPDNIDDLLTRPLSTMDVLANWSSVYRYYYQRKFSITQLMNAPDSLIGLAAITVGAGYRNDGSHAPGTFDAPPADPTISNIGTGTEGFEPSTTVSQGALAELDTLLADAHAKNIYVVGFLPPFAPSVYQKILTLPDQFGYLKTLAPDVSNIFKKYNFAFYDFTDPKSVGATEKQMADGIHLTEEGSFMLISKMAGAINAGCNNTHGLAMCGPRL